MVFLSLTSFLTYAMALREAAIGYSILKNF